MSSGCGSVFGVDIVMKGFKVLAQSYSSYRMKAISNALHYSYKGPSICICGEGVLACPNITASCSSSPGLILVFSPNLPLHFVKK